MDRPDSNTVWLLLDVFNGIGYTLLVLIIAVWLRVLFSTVADSTHPRHTLQPGPPAPKSDGKAPVEKEVCEPAPPEASRQKRMLCA